MQTPWTLPTGFTRQAFIATASVLVVALGYWWLSAPSSESSVTVRAVTRAATTAPAAVIVDVQGAVRHPGVLRLVAGARVIDAVHAAGGLLPGRDAVVNLARPVVDGEQLRIGEAAAGGGAMSASGKVDINRADAAALDALPGIGAVLAGRIVDFRAKHGPFRSLRELLQVPGIGDAKYADIADAITLG